MPIFALSKFALFGKKNQIQENFYGIQTLPQKAMKTYSDLTTSNHFLGRDIIYFIQDINDLINDYNGEKDPKQKFNLLREIQRSIQEFESLHPANDYFKDANPDYWNLQTFLHEEIKYQYASLGKSPVFDPTQDSPLATVIATMSAPKIQKLYAILDPKDKVSSNLKISKNKISSELKKLYEPTDQSHEAKMFRHFLKTHELNYLGGYNSKNYKFTEKNSGKAIVLKIEHRMSFNKESDLHLRSQKKFQSFIVPVATERLTHYKNESRRVQVTEFVQGADLLQDSFTLYDRPNPIEHTAMVFEQMAHRFSDVLDSNLCFTDAKLPNWLIDKNNILHVGDTKSFLFSENGKVRKLNDRICTTQGYRAPEFRQSEFKSGPAHSYLLGKNLYYYLTGANPRSYNDTHNGLDFDFYHPIFEKEDGVQLESLIKALVKKDPDERMPVQEALLHFKFINLRTELKQFTFGKNDSEMQKYLEKMRNSFVRAKNFEEKEFIIHKMERTLTSFNNNTILLELKNVINQCREKSTLFNGMKQKANRVEQCLSKMSLDDRMSKNEKTFNNAIRELASDSSFLTKRKIHEKDGEIDEKRSSQAFKDFKSKMKNHPKEDQEIDENSKNTPTRIQ